jgi:hypothetical protein
VTWGDKACLKAVLSDNTKLMPKELVGYFIVDAAHGSLK